MNIPFEAKYAMYLGILKMIDNMSKYASLEPPINLIVDDYAGIMAAINHHNEISPAPSAVQKIREVLNDFDNRYPRIFWLWLERNPVLGEAPGNEVVESRTYETVGI